MAYEGPHPFPVKSGGTGDSSFTAFAPICGGVSTTGALQSAGTGQSNSGYVWTSNGSSTLPSFQPTGSFTFSAVNIQTFTTSGTYTPTTGMISCIVEVLGGGGGGGGVSASGAVFGSGGGGGGGEYARAEFSSGTIGASQTVTIGSGGAGGAAGNNPGVAGGNTSVGALISANGGGGGAGYTASATGVQGCALGGSGGTGGAGGSFAFPGQEGQQAFFVTITGSGNLYVTAGGGSSFYGYGAPAKYNTAAGLAGANGPNYGVGGSGGTSVTLSEPGGNGSAGLIVITEFL